MTKLHFINTYGVICRGDEQDSYEEWSALVDGEKVEDFLPGNRMAALSAKDDLVAQYPDAEVIFVDQRIDWRGNRMLPGARSEFI